LNLRNLMITRCSTSRRSKILNVWTPLNVHFNFKLHSWLESS
jgi:hypothetical protein